MNEQIEDLLYHAGLTTQGCWDELGTYEQEAIKKLAELIVRECADKAHEFIIADGDEFPLQAVSYRIKEHFGVEE